MLVLALAPTPPSYAASNCEYVLGFKALHDLIPDKVGPCRSSEHHNPLNGDGLQETSGVDDKGGLLVWRKADNWTAYTDGYRTWINGPNGLQMRLNTERFPWEQEPTPVPVGTAVPDNVQWLQHQVPGMTIRYPADWTVSNHLERGIGRVIFTSPDARARFEIYTPMMAPGVTASEYLTVLSTTMAKTFPGFTAEGVRAVTIGGLPGAQQLQKSSGSKPSVSLLTIVQQGSYQRHLYAYADLDVWPTYEPLIRAMVGSYAPANSN